MTLPLTQTLDRQQDCNCGALPRVALEGQDAAMIPFDDFPGDGKTEAHATDLAGAEQA